MSDKKASEDKRTHVTKIGTRTWEAPEGKLFKVEGTPATKTLIGTELIQILKRDMQKRKDYWGLRWLHDGNLQSASEAVQKMIEAGYIKLVGVE